MRGGIAVAQENPAAFFEAYGTLMNLPLSRGHRDSRKLSIWSIVAVILVLTIGLCAFHIQHHGLSDSGMCPNPCSVVASLLVVTLFIVLLVVSLLGPERVESLYLIPLRPLEIPPEVQASI
jgi:hypothetical protein